MRDEKPPTWQDELRGLISDVRLLQADCMAVVERKSKADIRFLDIQREREQRIEQKIDRILSKVTGTARDVQEIRGSQEATAPEIKAAIDGAEQRGKKRHDELTDKIDTQSVPKYDGKLGAAIAFMREAKSMERWKFVTLMLAVFAGFVVAGFYVYEKTKQAPLCAERLK